MILSNSHILIKLKLKSKRVLQNIYERNITDFIGIMRNELVRNYSKWQEFFSELELIIIISPSSLWPLEIIFVFC